MNASWFELLLVVNVAITAAAVLRRRPATFMLAVTQALVLRSLAHIRDFGQPHSQWFIPEFVFSSEALDIAARLFSIGTLVTLVLIVLSPEARPGQPPLLEPLPRWLLTVLAIFFALIVILPANISDPGFDVQSRNTTWSIGGLNLSGMNSLIMGLFLYEVSRRVFSGKLQVGRAIVVVFALIFCTDYAKGSTGQATGCLLTILFLFAPRLTRQWWRTIPFLAALGGVIVITFVIREIRMVFSTSGWSTVSEVVDNTVHDLGRSQGDKTFEPADDAGIGNQYATHVLECIALYESGQSRQWRSFYNPLIYTFEPSFLLGPLDIVRPQEAPWELSEHFIHGGGIYTTGEFYWNGGYFGVLLGFLLMTGLAFFCDSRYRFSQAWLGMTCAFAPPLFEGIGYGFAHVFRGAVDGVLLVGLLWLFGRVRQRAGRRLPSHLGAKFAPSIRSSQAQAGHTV